MNEIQNYKNAIKTERLLNKRVIVRSNDYSENFKIGICVEIQLITKAQVAMPVVKFEDDNKEYCCMGIVILYDKDMEKILNEKSYQEQYHFLSRNKFNLNL